MVARQQSNFISKAFSTIGPTHPPAMITTLLLLQSKFSFNCTQCTLYTYKITFSGITPANRNRLRRNFTRRHYRVTWHAVLQTLRALRQTGAKWRRKTAFCELSRQGNNALFHLLSGGRFPWNFNTKCESVWSWKRSEQNFKIFPKRVIFPEKVHFRSFGVHMRRACSSLGLQAYGESEHCTL